jgi:GcrA cell cycle regulator
MEWNEDRVEMLRRLWLQGQSASQIAALLGGVTRNAVIGKAHRLGLSGRITVVKRETQPAIPARVGRSCQWPVGDPKEPNFHFCGQPVEGGRPYCASHCTVAYHRKTEVAA